MSTLLYIFAVWLAFAVLGAVLLYIGYGFAMSAVAARDKKLTPSPAHVVRLDVILVMPIIILDGLYNAVIMPVLCLDLRPSMAFHAFDDLVTSVTGDVALLSACPYLPPGTIVWGAYYDVGDGSLTTVGTPCVVRTVDDGDATALGSATSAA